MVKRTKNYKMSFGLKTRLALMHFSSIQAKHDFKNIMMDAEIEYAPKRAEAANRFVKEEKQSA